MYSKFIKRLIDIFLSIVSLFLLLPLLIFVSLILRFTGERKIFYLQDRVGFKNSIFKIFKFATMLENSPNIGSGSLTLRNDPRVLPFGRVLRKTKINELPQIINVLIGDMSIVGPRPQMREDYECYPSVIKEKIYNTKPGLTGLGSIVFRDEEEAISKSQDPREYYNRVIAPEKGQLELFYQRKISFLTDVKIIFATALVIIYPKTNVIYMLFKDLKEEK